MEEIEIECADDRLDVLQSTLSRMGDELRIEDAKEESSLLIRTIGKQGEKIAYYERTLLESRVELKAKEDELLKVSRILEKERETNAGNQQVWDRRNQELKLNWERSEEELRQAMSDSDRMKEIVAEKEAATKELNGFLLLANEKIATTEKTLRDLSTRYESSLKNSKDKLTEYEQNTKRLMFVISLKESELETSSRGAHDLLGELREELKKTQEDLGYKKRKLVDLTQQHRRTEESTAAKLLVLERSEKLVQELQLSLDDYQREIREKTALLTQAKEALKQAENRESELQNSVKNLTDQLGFAYKALEESKIRESSALQSYQTHLREKAELLTKLTDDLNSSNLQTLELVNQVKEMTQKASALEKYSEEKLTQITSFHSLESTGKDHKAEQVPKEMSVASSKSLESLIDCLNETLVYGNTNLESLIKNKDDIKNYAREILWIRICLDHASEGSSLTSCGCRCNYWKLSRLNELCKSFLELGLEMGEKIQLAATV